jgi:exopolysaccharide biosynthesis operon protein EpsL
MQHLRITLLFSAALLCGAASTAWAESAEGFTLNAAAALVNDSNLFRLPSDADLPSLIGNNSAADQVSITTLGINFSKAYSLQRLELDMSLAHYRYQNFSNLNNTANNYNAAWRWSLTPRFRGNLTTDRKETLNEFADVRGYQERNQRVNVTSRLDGAYDLGGAWSITAGAAESSQINPQNQTADADTVVRSLDTGFRYLYPSGSQWAYTLRNGKGNYRLSASQIASLIDDSFDQVDNEISLRWMLDGKSSATVRVTAINRTHPRFSQRDFNGIAAAANYTLHLTGKTSIAMGLSRDLSSYQSSTSNYSQTDRISITPLWRISPHSQVRLHHETSKRDYLGSPVALPTGATQRAENLQSTVLSLDWQPRPHLTLSAALQDARRSANLTGLDYQSSTASISAQISF